jgi:hypothetical protein
VRRSIMLCTRRSVFHSAAACARFISEISCEIWNSQRKSILILVLLLFVSFFPKTQQISPNRSPGLRFHCSLLPRFTRVFRSRSCAGRYMETTELAKSLTAFSL